MASPQPIDEYTRKANEFLSSNYTIIACGCRNVVFDELVSIIEIISNTSLIRKPLNLLHKYHPRTISFNKSQAQSSCPSFNNNCNCFLPDIQPEDHVCEVARREKYAKSSRKYPGYKQWRASVFERDKYTCQKCGQVGGVLNAHHIKEHSEYFELRLSVGNGITYCESCHKEEHHGKN